MLRPRAYAYLVDLLCVVILAQASFFTLTSTSKLLFYGVHPVIHTKVLASYIKLFPLFFICTYFTYFMASLYISNGKTIGKYLFGLKVISRHSQNIGLKTCFMRASIKTLAFGLFPISWSLGMMSFVLSFTFPYLRQSAQSLTDVFSFSQTVQQIVFEKFQAEKQTTYAKALSLSPMEGVIHLDYEGNVISFPGHDSEGPNSENSKKQAA